MYEVKSTIAGACTATALLAVEHVACWKLNLPLVVRYALGTGAIVAGATVSGALRDDLKPVRELCVIAGAGGALVVALHWWREIRGERPQDIEAAFQMGKLAAKWEVKSAVHRKQ